MSAALINAASYLAGLPAVLKDYLLTDEDARHAAYILEDHKELGAEINKALAGVTKGVTGKVGLSVVISTVTVGGHFPNAPAAFSMRNGVILEVIEVPEINRNASHSPEGTGYYGRAFAEMLWAKVKAFRSGETDWRGVNFYEQDIAIAPPVDMPGKPLAIVHPVQMFFPGGIEDDATTVATPVISGSAATFYSITCATAGAAIYYTVGSSISRPLFFGAGNTNNVGTLYTAQFTATAGQIIAARAFKDGMRASLIATTTAA